MAKLAFAIDSDKDIEALTRCLSDMPLTGRQIWDKIREHPATIKGVNEARHLSIEIIDLEDHRQVKIFTREARALRKQEKNLISFCLR